MQTALSGGYIFKLNCVFNSIKFKVLNVYAYL